MKFHSLALTSGFSCLTGCHILWKNGKDTLIVGIIYATLVCWIIDKDFYFCCLVHSKRDLICVRASFFFSHEVKKQMIMVQFIAYCSLGRATTFFIIIILRSRDEYWTFHVHITEPVSLLFSMFAFEGHLITLPLKNSGRSFTFTMIFPTKGHIYAVELQ